MVAVAIVCGSLVFFFVLGFVLYKGKPQLISICLKVEYYKIKLEIIPKCKASGWLKLMTSLRSQFNDPGSIITKQANLKHMIGYMETSLKGVLND